MCLLLLIQFDDNNESVFFALKLRKEHLKEMFVKIVGIFLPEFFRIKNYQKVDQFLQSHFLKNFVQF